MIRQRKTEPAVQPQIGVETLDARTFSRTKFGAVKFGVVSFLALVVLLVLPSSLILAQGTDQGSGQQAIVNGNFTLHSDQKINGNYTIAARTVQTEAGSTVMGDLSIVSMGDVTLSGEVDGNVSVIVLGGTVQVDPGAHIGGNLSICARAEKIDPAAVIGGSQNTGCDQLGSILNGKLSGGISSLSGVPFASTEINPVAKALRTILTSFVVAALAALLSAIFPVRMRRLTETAITVSATAGVVGFLSFGVALAVTLIYLLLIAVTLGIACLGLPVFGVGWLIIIIGLIVGWMAVSIPLGTLLLRRFKVYPTTPASAALGTLVLTLVQGLLTLIPCVGFVGWLLLIVLGSVGFGAVLLTRFGSHAYPIIITARAKPKIL